MQAEDLESLFMLPPTKVAFADLKNLQEFLQTVAFDNNQKDKWTLIWGLNTYNTYSSSKLYKIAFQNVDTLLGLEIQMHQHSNRIKFFTWLILVDRLNTKSMLKRRNLLAED